MKEFKSKGAFEIEAGEKLELTVNDLVELLTTGQGTRVFQCVDADTGEETSIVATSPLSIKNILMDWGLNEKEAFRPATMIWLLGVGRTYAPVESGLAGGDWTRLA